MEQIIDSSFFEVTQADLDRELAELFENEPDLQTNTTEKGDTTLLAEAIMDDAVSTGLLELLSTDTSPLITGSDPLADGDFPSVGQLYGPLLAVPENIFDEEEGKEAASSAKVEAERPFSVSPVEAERPFSVSPDLIVYPESDSDSEGSVDVSTDTEAASLTAPVADHHSYSRSSKTRRQRGGAASRTAAARSKGERAGGRPRVEPRPEPASLSSRKRKLYELGPLDDPEAERCRQNAVNAKINRDKKKAQMQEAEAEIDRLRDENQSLKVQKDRYRDELEEARRELALLRQQMKMGRVNIVNCLGNARGHHKKCA